MKTLCDIWDWIIDFIIWPLLVICCIPYIMVGAIYKVITEKPEDNK